MVEGLKWNVLLFSLVSASFVMDLIKRVDLEPIPEDALRDLLAAIYLPRNPLCARVGSRVQRRCMQPMPTLCMRATAGKRNSNSRCSIPFCLTAGDYVTNAICTSSCSVPIILRDSPRLPHIWQSPLPRM